MIILIEGIVMCFLLLITCVIGIANGPVGLVVLYEKDLQPYIPKKVLLRKWLGTIFVYPMFAAIIAGIMTMI